MNEQVVKSGRWKKFDGIAIKMLFESDTCMTFSAT